MRIPLFLLHYWEFLLMSMMCSPQKHQKYQNHNYHSYLYNMYIPLQLFGDLNHPQMLHLIDLYNFEMHTPLFP